MPASPICPILRLSLALRPFPFLSRRPYTPAPVWKKKKKGQASDLVVMKRTERILLVWKMRCAFPLNPALSGDKKKKENGGRANGKGRVGKIHERQDGRILYRLDANPKRSTAPSKPRSGGLC